MFSTFFYKLLRIFVCLLHRLYYQKVEIKGLDNIPTNEPVIFAPNHQNAIMDALVLVCHIKKPILFLARGNFFKNKIIRKIFRFLRIIPVYRKSEGFHNISKNSETFETAKKYLIQNGYVCIMPEAGHAGVSYIRPLSKGIFRLALSVQQSQLNKSIVIIPVGIYYSSYYNYFSKVIVNFGKPIEVNKYISYSKFNQPFIFNNLRKILENKMKSVALHIQYNEYYHFIQQISKFVPFIIDNRKIIDNFSLQFDIQKAFTQHCNNLCIDEREKLTNAYQHYKPIAELLTQWSNYPHIICHHSNKSWLIGKSIAAILIIPFTAILFIYYLIPVFFPKLFNQLITDRQFYSSIQFVMLFLGLPIWQTFMFFMVLWTTKNTFYAIMVLIVSTFSFSFLFPTIHFFKILFRQWKANYLHLNVKFEMLQIIKIMGFNLQQDVAKY